MAENETPDGGQESQEQVAGAARPTFASETSGDSGSSADVSSLANSILERLDPLIDEKLSRRDQSIKDKRIAEIEKRLNASTVDWSAYEALREKHGPSEAQRILSQEARLATMEQTLTQAQQAQVSSPQVANQDWVSQEKSLLSEAGLSINDPDVSQLAASRDWSQYGGKGPDTYLMELRSLIARKAQNPQPTPGSAPAPAGGLGAQPDLRAEYDKKLAELPRGPQRINGKMALMAEYRKKGLDLSGEA